jgi:WD40 repeat protein
VNGVMFSADSQTIASVGDDRTLRLWHVNGQALLSFEAHDDRVLSVAFSADNQQLLTTSADQTLRVWDLNPDNLVRQGCDWVKPYLDDNPSVAEESRHICDDVVR